MNTCFPKPKSAASSTENGKAKAATFRFFVCFRSIRRVFSRARVTLATRPTANSVLYTPKLEIRGGFAFFDARRYVDGIDRATDIAIVCDFSNGQAFGLVRGARWAKGIVRIPLHFLSDKKSAKPSCVVGVNGNFDFAPDSMASSPAFHFNVIEYSITCVLPQRAAFC